MAQSLYFPHKQLETKWSESWADMYGYKSDAVIEVKHGGGYFFLRDFLSGKHEGYKLENDGLGIQVAPIHKGPEKYYAYRHAPAYFDLPAQLTGRIAAGQLHKANNDYEAGLYHDRIDQLNDVKIELFDFNLEEYLKKTSGMYTFLNSSPEGSCNKLYGKDSERCRRITEVIRPHFQKKTVSSRPAQSRTIKPRRSKSRSVRLLPCLLMFALAVAVSLIAKTSLYGSESA